MSADNMIAVLKVRDDLYLVQHAVSFEPEFLTEDELIASFASAQDFATRLEALDYAYELEREEDICEYGVCVFDLGAAGYKTFADLPEDEKKWRKDDKYSAPEEVSKRAQEVKSQNPSPNPDWIKSHSQWRFLSEKNQKIVLSLPQSQQIDAVEAFYWSQAHPELMKAALS